MEISNTALLFALLRSGLNGTSVQENEKNEYNADMLPELAKTASRHDLSHILALGLVNSALIDKNDAGVRKILMRTVYRYERIKFELDRMCDAFEKSEIPFIPLKGSVIRKYYPEPWMRTSCDIDVLVGEDNCDKAADLLVSELGYVRKGKGSHDISMFTPGGLHVEIHYALVEDNVLDKSSAVLERVWEVSTAADGCTYRMEMPDEMFYFYHMAHMAKHFQNGGCGIRTFIDLWILDNLSDVDTEKRDALLEEGDIFKFAIAARRLSKVWFGGAEHDALTERMESYILHGGVYGTNDNRVMVNQQQRGGKLRFALSRIFIPYDVIKFHYPILQKHKWLLPIMQVRRWGKLIFCGHLRRTVKELNYNSNVPKSKADEMKLFLDDLGLM